MDVSFAGIFIESGHSFQNIDCILRLCGGLYYGGDPKKRVRVRKCDDPGHLEVLKGYDNTIMHCHHVEGCLRS